MQQLYAKIKKSSKYYYQNKLSVENGMGLPFKVEIKVSSWEYCVSGGAGGQYRLSDVNLFIIENGIEFKIK